MDITHYYFNASYGTQLKNRLQKELYEVLIGLDGLIIEEESLKNFMHNLNKKAAELNLKHKRCKPIEFGTYSYGSAGLEKTISVTGFEAMNLQLLGGSLWYMTDKKIL